MISCIVLKGMIQRFKSFTPEFRLTSGIVSVIIVSFVLFIVTTFFGLSEDVFSLGMTVFGNGHVHKLITYSFHHKTVTQLLLSIGVLGPLCGGIEKNVGTVRFLFMFLLLSISTGVLYSILGLLLFGASAQNQVEGFIPVSLSLMCMATVHSRMVKGFLFGVTVPMLALPWLFLFIITLLVPHTVFLCNVIAIIAGGIYGKGWLSLLDMSDARASVLDKKMPFRLLRNIGVLYVPASIEARRKTVHPPIIPTPGSYPVQAYAPVSSTSNLQATETTPKTFEGWAHSYYTQGSPVQLSGYYGHNHGYGIKHSFGPSHGHGHKHGYSCSHSQGHGHSHEHSFGHGLSHEHASASQTSSHCAPVAQHPHSQHSHLSPLSVSVSAPQSFTANMPESLPESVTVHPGAPVSSLTD
ncbi:rhomboid domain-containing protein 2 isoform 1-T1 [Salvelinus alpinus]|uniref:rhomboid domain-containing protein 2 n=1 Tax=Salvelinus alpinus TaxID=8036 RepID=UPI000CDFAFDF|nr:rhomboid domain-containing protein 2 isoform X1 [Salvelinus alpinus]